MNHLITPSKSNSERPLGEKSNRGVGKEGRTSVSPPVPSIRRVMSCELSYMVLISGPSKSKNDFKSLGDSFFLHKNRLDYLQHVS